MSGDFPGFAPALLSDSEGIDIRFRPAVQAGPEEFDGWFRPAVQACPWPVAAHIAGLSVL